MDDRAALDLARRDPRRQLGRFLLLSELGRGGMGVVHRDHDLIVQWARTLLAPAPRRPAWLQEALPLLGRVIEEDPLHGDARELRASILIELDALGVPVDLAVAGADLALALHDLERGAASTMRGGRRTPRSVAGFQADLRQRRQARR